MNGFGETVGGWFGSSIVGKMLDMVGSYLGKNIALQSETAEMVTSLKNSLPQIQYAIVEARKMPTKTPALIKWLDNLINAAYEVKDVLDDFEAKKIRERLKGKNEIAESGKFIKALFRADIESMKLKSVVENMNKITGEVRDFLDHVRNEYSANANISHINTHRRETSSYLDTNSKIFGRDVEIYFILDLILNYQLMCISKGNSETKSQPNPPTEGEPKLPDQQEALETSRGKREWSSSEESARNKRRGTQISSFSGSVQESRGKRKWSSGTSSQAGKESMKLYRGYQNPLNWGRQPVRGYQTPVRIGNWKLPVLPICGLGGVGKTTIAQMVYNNDKVTEAFDLRAWVYVSQKFDVMTIMKKIIDLLKGSVSCITTDNGRELVERELVETIEYRRFFLVLDDVHDRIEPIWWDLFSVLSNGAPGSFILVTTQSERVAKIIENMSIIINLDALEPEWFELLFKYYAFGELFNYDGKSGSSSISCKNDTAKAQFNNLTEDKLSDLESIATKIAEKLHGLPLAGQIIGKMLYNKLDKGQYWEEILKSDLWGNESTSKEILASLEIGYKGLGPELQQCFKFCSIFPKHYVFDRNTLVQMWLAHDFDFVQPNEEESLKLSTKEIKLEDIGGERFDKLVERSFFQATVNDDKYVMHDLIRELAIVVPPKHEFYYVKSLDNKIPPVTRHMGIDCDGSNREEITPIDTTLRTAILFGNWIKCSSESIRNIFAISNGLRLLDLSYIRIKENARPLDIINIGKDEILDAICQQSHLRYVDLSFSGIDFIPNKFCELYHLRVLDVRGCNFIGLPKQMNELVNLRYLYASAETLSLISGIGKLTNLQELQEFRVGVCEGHRISELRDMNEISGHLLLTNLQNVPSKEEAATCQLAKKKYLKSLELAFDHFEYQSTRVELEVLEALQPYPNVETLTVSGGRGDSLPSWMWSTQSEFANLRCIKVINFSLTTLPAFGDLPSLKVLIFEEISKLEKVGVEFYGRSDVVFPSLKELQFSFMHCWRTWSDTPAEKKSFPLLKKMRLELCEDLVEMPINIFTSPVVELKLSNCPNINNIETILQCMPHLTNLTISRCCKDLSIYCSALRYLEVLCLEGVKRLCFIRGLKDLVNLKKLEIEEFNEILESYEEGEWNDGTCQENRFLTSLKLSYYNPSLIQQQVQLPLAARLGYLRSLLIRDSPVTEYTEEEGSWFSQLTSLETLEFSKCWHLRGLPSTLPLLAKLKKLTITCCPEISSLPEFGLPPYLTELYITECSDELVSRCQPEPDEGDDWWKISHIPHVQIEMGTSTRRHRWYT